ncbi:cobyrinic acid a,c-diamide synthase [Methylohalomonas lacus]|uniref:Cobyrinate a,c-diamide synthase n=1 Tax=Methylohalomonas lacus TaxID=398773 RepID=A0AAE3HK66_9GAMM|nr:cobyrinate a,c-diamide synthase [Methylohalomonas lacus]MCS3902688.1 cobyrinic acid a,c-diamide synthase [Methylohalomonas lacus]
MTAARSCPALLIAAPASGHGKTTVTAALARYHRNQGRRVRVFKAGPDFLDPMIHERASGAPVYQLDLWLVGETACRRLLYEAAADADLILVEGVMGLFDGNPSSADLAAKFGLPVLAVIDARAMAQTFGAVALGLDRYRDGVHVTGVIANRVGSPTHREMLTGALPDGIDFYGSLPRDEAITLPDRHLGLVQAEEVDDLDARLDAAADQLGQDMQVELPAASEFTLAAAEDTTSGQPLAGRCIAVARDRAFAFVYRANLDLLTELGAELVYFSPLNGEDLPPADAVYLPGGYPELHVDALAANESLKQALADHHAAGKPLVAECGGMLYLLESLTDKHGTAAAMAGLLPGTAVMQERLTALALQSVTLPEGTLRGHTFHHSRMDSPLEAIARGECPNRRRAAEAVYRDGRLTASYIHFYLPSNPAAAAAMFQ